LHNEKILRKKPFPLKCFYKRSVLIAPPMSLLIPTLVISTLVA